MAPLDGPSLETYVETRLNLLTTAIEAQGAQGHAEVAAFIEATRLAVVAKAAADKEVQAMTDLRYQQRFEAQSDALAAAFLSQQTAMQTAFVVAEKAVQAALAAADRAVSKAELAADKRFEALNELRQMLNDMVGTLITRLEAVQRFDAMAEKIDTGAKRTEVLEARLNTFTGEQVGGERRSANISASVGLIVAVVGGLLALITFFALRR